MGFTVTDNDIAIFDTGQSLADWLDGQAESSTTYHLVGDGVTNNAPMLQAFLDASAAAGGLCLDLPPGNYLVSTPLTYPTTANGFVIRGSNQNTSIITVATGSWLMDLNVTSSRTGFGFRDLTIQCNSGSNGISFGNTSATLYNFLLLIERCIITGAGPSSTSSIGSVFNDTTGVITRSGQVGVRLNRMFRSKIKDCFIRYFDYGLDMYECDHPAISSNFTLCQTAIRARTPSGSTYSIQHVISGTQIEGIWLTGFAGENCTIAIGDGTRMEATGGAGTGIWDITAKLAITAACTEGGTTWTLSGAINPLIIPLGECVLELVEAATPFRVARVIPISYDGNVTVGVVSTFSNNPPRYQVPWTSTGCTIRRVTGNGMLSNACAGSVAQCSLAPLVNEGYSIFHVAGRGSLTVSDTSSSQPVGLQGNMSGPEHQVGDGVMVLRNVPRAMMPVNEHPFVVVDGHAVRSNSVVRWGQTENDNPLEKLAQRFVFTPHNYGYWNTSSLYPTPRITEYIDDVISGRPIWVWQVSSTKFPTFALAAIPSILRWAGVKITIYCKATVATSKTIRIRLWNEIDGEDSSINLVTTNTSTAWQRLVYYATTLPPFWSSVTRTAGAAAGVRVNTTVSDLMIAGVMIEELTRSPQRSRVIPCTQWFKNTAIKDILADGAGTSLLGLGDSTGSILSGSQTNNTSVTESAAAIIAIPDDFVRGGTKIRIRAKVSTARFVASTVVGALKLYSDTGQGSDLVTTAATTITTTIADYDFDVTDTTLSAGDQVTITITALNNDTGGNSNGTITLPKISLLYFADDPLEPV